MKAQDIFCFPPTIADVPEACLPSLSLVVTEIVRRMLDADKQQAAAAWKLFFLLPRMVFNLPRGGRTAQSRVQTRLALFAQGEWQALLNTSAANLRNAAPPRCSKDQQQQDQATRNEQDRRAVSFARAGNFGGAIRSLVPCIVQDTRDEKVFANLQLLHPRETQGNTLWAPHAAAPELDDVLIQKVLRALPPRRAADAAGCSICHKAGLILAQAHTTHT